jgi:hypothetical protein
VRPILLSTLLLQFAKSVDSTINRLGATPIFLLQGTKVRHRQMIDFIDSIQQSIGAQAGDWLHWFDSTINSSHVIQLDKSMDSTINRLVGSSLIFHGQGLQWGCMVPQLHHVKTSVDYRNSKMDPHRVLYFWLYNEIVNSERRPPPQYTGNWCFLLIHCHANSPLANDVSLLWLCEIVKSTRLWIQRGDHCHNTQQHVFFSTKLSCQFAIHEELYSEIMHSKQQFTVF